MEWKRLDLKVEANQKTCSECKGRIDEIREDSMERTWLPQQLQTQKGEHWSVSFSWLCAAFPACSEWWISLSKGLSMHGIVVKTKTYKDNMTDKAFMIFKMQRYVINSCNWVAKSTPAICAYSFNNHTDAFQVEIYRKVDRWDRYFI